MEIDVNKIIKALMDIADEVEKKHPGYIEKIRQELFSQDANIFEAIDEAAEIELVEDEVTKEE